MVLPARLINETEGRQGGHNRNARKWVKKISQLMSQTAGRLLAKS